MQSSLERAAEIAERTPSWFRPIIYGPLILLFAIILRGGILIVPIALIYLLFFSHNRLADLKLGAEIAGLLFGSAAVGGLVHGLIGRRVVALPVLGPYLAGVLAISPYIIALGCLSQLEEHHTLFAPWDDSSYIAAIFCALLFGSILGHSLFRD